MNDPTRATRGIGTHPKIGYVPISPISPIKPDQPDQPISQCVGNAWDRDTSQNRMCPDPIKPDQRI